MHHPPTPPGPPGADVPATIPTQTAQNAEGRCHTGTGPLADAPRRQWRARLACGHDLVVTHVHCPTCGHCQPVDILPLTALSDPDNVGWVRTGQEEEQ